MTRFHTSIFATLLAATGLAISATAQEQADTTLLKEIVVQGENGTFTSKGAIFLPTKREKSHSHNAYTLLDNMQIPLLRSHPGSSPTTMAGEALAYFIDGVPATADDCAALRPSQVVRVEYMQYTTDPRYGGQQNIVNFVMKQMDWGGYARLAPTQYFLNTYGNYPLYAKVKRGRVTYDLTAGASWSDTHSERTAMTETFQGIMPVSDEKITRTTETRTPRDTHKYNATARVMYNDPTTGRTLSSTIGYYWNAAGSLQNGSLLYRPDNLFPGLNSSTRSHSQSHGLTWSGYAFLPLSSTWYLNARPSFSWGRNNNASLYMGAGEEIDNGARENAYSPNVTLTLTKLLKPNMALELMGLSYNTFYDTDYRGNLAGTDPHQKLSKSEDMILVFFKQQLPCGMAWGIRPGISFTYAKTGGSDSYTQWNPRLAGYLQYNYGQRNYYSLNIAWGNNTPQASTSNDLLRQVDELMWVQGNPRLKNIKMYSGDFSYSHIFSNAFSLSVSADYNGYIDYTVETYRPDPESCRMVRSFGNIPHYGAFNSGLQAPIKLCQGRLVFTPSLYYNFYSRSASDFSPVRNHLHSVVCGLNAQAYLGGFQLSGYIYCPQRTLEEQLTKYPVQYGLSLSWYKGELALSASINNWFKTMKHTGYSLTTPYFTRTVEEYDYSRIFSLTVSYTISFGRQTNRGNEIKSSEAPASSVM